MSNHEPVEQTTLMPYWFHSYTRRWSDGDETYERRCNNRNAKNTNWINQLHINVANDSETTVRTYELLDICTNKLMFIYDLAVERINNAKKQRRLL